MMNIKTASIEDIPEIQRLSNEIWKKVYPSVVTLDQIEYMLERIYSHDSLTNQMEDLKHQFILVQWNDENVGYASYSIKSAEEPNRFRLHKLYMQPETHGNGLGKGVLKYIINQILPLGAKELELNVHKRNPAYHFYLYMGFLVEQALVIEFGPYLLDDYIMSLDLIKNPL